VGLKKQGSKRSFWSWGAKITRQKEEFNQVYFDGLFYFIFFKGWKV